MGELLVKILKLDCESGNCLLQFLVNGVELPEPFLLRYFAMKELEELSVNVLEHRELPRVVARIPSGSRSIEGQCKFHGGEPLCRMIGLPCGHEGMDVGFRIRAICIPGTWVWHGVEIRFFWKRWKGVVFRLVNFGRT